MGPAQSMCGENLLQKLMTQYGGDLVKFITAEKSKFIIQEKFTQLQRKFHQAFQNFQHTLQQISDEKTTEITTAFQGIKNKANSLLPGGIAVLERVKGQSINDFSGFNSLVSKIQSIKSESLGNLSLKKNQMMQKLSQEKTQMTHNIEKTQPKIPVYEQVPEPLRKQLFRQAQKKFSNELGSKQDELQNQILGIFNGSALQKMFNEMSPQGLLKKIISQGFVMLQKNVFANITGGTSGSFGNLAGNIGNLANVGGQKVGGFGNIFNNIVR